MKIIFNKPKKKANKLLMNVENKLEIIKNKIKDNKQKPDLKQYTLLVLMILVGVLSLNLSIQENKELDEEEYETYTLEKDTSEANSNNIEYQTAISSISTNVANKEKEISMKSEYILPTDGKVMKKYSTDELILSETLDMWMTHDGIDVSGNLGDKVYAIADGTIDSIYQDALYGTSVIINHSNGFTSVYSNLDKQINIKEKEKTKKGSPIGKVGNTAIIEVNDAPHIHLEILKDGNIIDPATIGLN